MIPGRDLAVDQRRDKLTDHVEDRNVDSLIFRQLIPNGRGGIERIRIVPVETDFLGKSFRGNRGNPDGFH